jgi:hypothetical protein
MVDGFWTVEFMGIPGLVGGGVVIFSKGALIGGDSQYYYMGRYTEERGTLEATVSVTAFVAQPMSAFGTNEQSFGLSFSGVVGPAVINANGFRAENPRMTMKLRLTRRADLPA